MSIKADIIDLLDNATENSLEKIYDIVNQIISEEKGNKVYTIEEIKEKAIPIAKKYGVKKLSLFGSYARGEANAKSDLDFIYDDINSKEMFAYFGFIQDLENEFKCHIDLVSDNISDKAFLSDIKNDEVILYAEWKSHR